VVVFVALQGLLCELVRLETGGAVVSGLRDFFTEPFPTASFLVVAGAFLACCFGVWWLSRKPRARLHPLNNHNLAELKRGPNRHRKFK
jgi:hypothetical protein